MKCKFYIRQRNAITFSPETGSVTGLSIGSCLKNMLPRVARNNILSNAIAFSFGTSPLTKPTFTCLAGSVDISYINQQKIIMPKRNQKCLYNTSRTLRDETSYNLVLQGTLCGQHPTIFTCS
jgi:hypothetical protein